MYDKAITAIKYYGLPLGHLALAKAFEAAKSGFVDGDIYPFGRGVTVTVLPGDRVAVRDWLGETATLSLYDMSALAVEDLMIAKVMSIYCWMVLDSGEEPCYV